MIVSGNAQLEYIFYSNATHISYIPVDGKISTAILEAQSATLGYDQLAYRLWYKSDVSLFNANLDASDVQAVVIPSTFGAFTVDSKDKVIYFLDESKKTVKSINYDGDTLADIAALQNEPDFRDLQVDDTNRLVITRITIQNINPRTFSTIYSSLFPRSDGDTRLIP